MSRKVVLCFCDVREDCLITVHMLGGIPTEVVASVTAAVVRYAQSKGVTPEMLQEHLEGIKCQGPTGGVDVRVTDFIDPSVN